MKKIRYILTNFINLSYVLFGFLFIGSIALFSVGPYGFMGVENSLPIRAVGFAATGVLLFRLYILGVMILHRTWKSLHIYLLLLVDTLIILSFQYAEYIDEPSYIREEFSFQDYYFYLGDFYIFIVVLLLNLALAPPAIGMLRQMRLSK